jgi:hypothetical protein
MAGPTVLIFHRQASAGDAPLVRLLADVRLRLAERHARLFEQAGAGEIRIVAGDARPFGEQLLAAAPSAGGAVVLGSGSVARLSRGDARRMVDLAAAGGFRALTNNRYSSDVCAVSDARRFRELPPLPSDNALPRWLEERAGYEVYELPGRERLALDIDTPLDIGLWAIAPGRPVWVRELVEREGLRVPRLEALREVAADPQAELLVFGRAGSATLRWLERNVRCRVRFLAEERGLRASSVLAIGGRASVRARRGLAQRPPRASMGLLLDAAEPGARGQGEIGVAERRASALAEVVAQLADGAIIDSRVLTAHHFGRDEDTWPSPADRFASDLLRTTEVSDPWLRALTASAAASDRPILLGSHTLVGPGIRLMLGGAAAR